MTIVVFSVQVPTGRREEVLAKLRELEETLELTVDECVEIEDELLPGEQTEGGG